MGEPVVALSRLLHSLGTLFAHLVAALVMLTVGAVTLLSDGPDPELVELARARIVQALGPGHALDIGRVGWGVESGSPALRLDGLVLRVPSGAVIDVRSAAIGLRLPDIRGPSRLKLRSLRAEGVRVRTPKAGPVRLPTLQAFEAALRSAVIGGRERLLGLGIERVALRDLVVEPAREAATPGLRGRLERRWVSLPSLDAVRRGRDYDVDLTVALAEGRLPLRAQLTPNGLVGESAAPVPANRLWAVDSFVAELPLTVRFAIPSDVGRPVVLGVDAASGPVRIGREVYRVDGLGLLAELREGRAEIGSLSLVAGASVLEGRGAIEMDGPRRVRLRVEQAEGAVAPSDLPEDSRPVAVTAHGTIDLDRRDLFFDRLAVDVPDGSITGTARIGLRGRSPSLAISLQTDGVDARTVPVMWPAWIAAEARAWVRTNVPEGRVVSASLRVDLAEGRLARLPDPLELTPDELRVEARVANLTSALFGEVPPLRNASGLIEVKGRAVEVSVTDGTVAAAGAGPVAVRDGTFAIPDFTEPDLPARFDVALLGEARSVATVAEAEPIGAMTQAGLRAGALDGRVSGRVRGDVALKRPESRDWEVELALDRLSIGDAIEGRIFSGLDGTLRVTPLLAELRATGAVDGMKAKFSLNEPLTPGVDSIRTVEMALDRAALDRLAPGLSDYVRGTVDVTAEVGPEAIEVEADIRRASITLPWVAWRKAEGIPGQARFTVEMAGGSTRIRDLVVVGKGFGASGEARVDERGLASIRLDRIALSPGDEASLSVERKGGGYVIAADGRRFDARGLIRALDPRHNETTGGSAGTMRVRARIGELAGFGGTSLRKAEIAYESAAGAMRSLSVRAGMARRGTLAVDGSGGNGQSVFLTTDNLGELLRFMDMYDRMRGGVVTVTATRDRVGTWRGVADGGRIELIDEPRLRLLAGKAGRRSRKLDAKRVYLARTFSDFTYRDGRLDVSDAIIRGPEIGARFDGTVVDAEKRIGLTGTFLPAYGVNRVFGEVPLLGAFLGNGKEKGLFGLTFRVRGKATNPTVEVNPLSIIAPGILRRIFEYEP